ncbi:MAG: hypothetical protein HY916_03830 [Desulfovibrio sp.]|jgi:hypothetical protein|nr:hypothetical protein [Desulfovibrio sp.]
MDWILICSGLLIAIIILRQRGQESDAEVYAPIRVDSDDSHTSGAIFGTSVLMDESSCSLSDDNWPTSRMMDDSPVSIGYKSDTSTDTSRWTDPMYAYELDNIYHCTLIDPTHHDDSFSSSSDDNWLSSTTNFDDSFSSSSSDDAWSSSGFDDSFSSSGFND